MTKDDAGHNKLQWHPAFLQAIQMELFDYREYLEFKCEYNPTSEPLRIDLLIIKKPKELVINKNIARIFRTDNVVEYKSPDDYLSIKDFWKVCSYANHYAAITPGVDLADVTLTFVGSRHPRKLLSYLTNTRGYTVEEISPGIYRVSGDYLPIQIIESSKLSEDENLWLNFLREGLKESSMDVILEEGKKLEQEINIDAYLDVILRANQKTFKEVYNMKKYPSLEEILTEVGFVPEMIERGRIQGIEKTARNLLARSMPIEEIAQVTELPVEKIRSLAAAH
jgi:hypothetical protein